MPTSAARRSLTLWLALTAALAVGFAIDAPVMHLVKPLHDSQLSDAIQASVRWLGTGYVQLPLALVMIALGLARSPRLRQAGVGVFLAFLISGVMVNVLKPLIHRARPYVTDPRPDTWLGYLHDGHYQSFPSAESATTFAVAFTLTGWYPALRWPLLAVAICVGTARVLVGNHHPSDVIAGAMLGLAVARFMLRRKPPQNDA